MPTPFISPILRLVAEGKAVPVSPEAEARLLEHMQKHYVPTAVAAARRNRAAGEAIKDVLLQK